MSMGLHTLSGVYQATWIEMKHNVTMRYEVDRENEVATLYFGEREEYSLTIGRANLDQLLHLGAAVFQELGQVAPG